MERSKIAVVTGANRGIGLELARQFADRGYRVYAGCRKPESAQALQEAGPGIEPVRLDVTSDAQIQALRDRLEKETDGVHRLIHNAGIFAEGEIGLDDVRRERMLGVFEVNCVSPVILTRELRGLLRKAGHAQVALIGSGAGVLFEQPLRPARQLSYSPSKAAAHMLATILAGELQSDGIMAVTLTPGFVKTDMTAWADPPPSLLPEDSARGMLDCLDRLTMADSGQIFDYRGERRDWFVRK